MSTDAYNEILSRLSELTPDEEEQLLRQLASAAEQRAKPNGSRSILERSILELGGLGKEIWAGIDAVQYVREERASWGG